MVNVLWGLLWLAGVAGLPFVFQWPVGWHLEFVNNVALWTVICVGSPVWFSSRISSSIGVAVTGLLGALVLGVVVLWALSSPVLGAGAFYALATDQAREAGVEMLDRPDSLLRISTRTTAWQVANKALGGNTTIDGKQVQLTSQYEVDSDRGTVQVLKAASHSGLYWVFPLDYSGLFAALSLSHVPGYVLVSATDPTAPAEVHLDQPMQVTPNAFGANNLGYKLSWTLVGDKILGWELVLDKQLKPWWVASLGQPQVVLGAESVEAVALVDAANGAVTRLSRVEFLSRHASGELDWISRIIPEAVAAERLDWAGRYAGGWLNSLGIPGTNVLQRTPYSENQLWFVPMPTSAAWLSGMTSMNNKDYSLVNLSLVDTLTGQLTVIAVRGTEEDGAVKMVQGALGAAGRVWRPVLPNPVVVNGAPYWSLVVVDDQDLFRTLALVKFDSTSEVFFGNTFAELRAQAGAGQMLELAPGAAEQTYTVELTAEELSVLRRVLQKLGTR